MDRVRRISDMLLQRYGSRFGTDFEENKKVVSEIAVIRSKQLRNQIAGYITVVKRGEVVEQARVAAEAPVPQAVATAEPGR